MFQQLSALYKWRGRAGGGAGGGAEGGTGGGAGVGMKRKGQSSVHQGTNGRCCF